jgi:hypothetical protein
MEAFKRAEAGVPKFTSQLNSEEVVQEKYKQFTSQLNKTEVAKEEFKPPAKKLVVTDVFVPVDNWGVSKQRATPARVEQTNSLRGKTPESVQAKTELHADRKTESRNADIHNFTNEPKTKARAVSAIATNFISSDPSLSKDTAGFKKSSKELKQNPEKTLVTHSTAKQTAPVAKIDKTQLQPV